MCLGCDQNHILHNIAGLHAAYALEDYDRRLHKETEPSKRGFPDETPEGSLTSRVIQAFVPQDSHDDHCLLLQSLARTFVKEYGRGIRAGHERRFGNPPTMLVNRRSSTFRERRKVLDGIERAWRQVPSLTLGTLMSNPIPIYYSNEVRSVRDSEWGPWCREAAKSMRRFNPGEPGRGASRTRTNPRPSAKPRGRRSPDAR